MRRLAKVLLFAIVLGGFVAFTRVHREKVYQRTFDEERGRYVTELRGDTLEVGLEFSPWYWESKCSTPVVGPFRRMWSIDRGPGSLLGPASAVCGARFGCGRKRGPPVSTATKPERRKLTFATLDDVVRDAESLLAKGYDKAGNWDLAQVCSHLAEWMRFPMDGFPRLPLLLRPMFWLMRSTIGPKIRRKILAEGFPVGSRTMPQTVPQPGGDAAVAVATLKEVAERFKAYAGPIVPSPLFGVMNKDEALQLQLKHCEHHLSFLIPKT